MFSFSVSCKDVGFMIHNIKSYSCKSFAIFFHLCSGGGPNLHREFSLWCAEQEAEWTSIGANAKKSLLML